MGNKKLTQGEVDKVLAEVGFVPEEGWVYKNNRALIPGRWNGCIHPNPTLPRYMHVAKGLSHGCSKCVGLTQGEVDKVLAEVGFVPEEGWVYKNNHTPIPGRWEGCTHENPTFPRYVNIANGVTRGCMKCGGAKKGKKQLISQSEVNAALDAAGFSPDEGWSHTGEQVPIPGTWVDCGHHAFPTYTNIKYQKSKCRSCLWLHHDGPTCVYLLRNSELRAIKVGITFVDSMRLRNFKRTGWKLVVRKIVDTRIDAEKREGQIFAELIAAGHPRAYLSADLVPAGGHTETFEEDALDLALELLHEESKQLIG